MLAPSSKLKLRLGVLLKDEGYIAGYDVRDDDDGIAEIVVRLRWADPRTNAITGLRRVSRPASACTSGHGTIPKVRIGLGIAILSTSQG